MNKWEVDMILRAIEDSMSLKMDLNHRVSAMVLMQVVWEVEFVRHIEVLSEDFDGDVWFYSIKVNKEFEVSFVTEIDIVEGKVKAWERYSLSLS